MDTLHPQYAPPPLSAMAQWRQERSYLRAERMRLYGSYDAPLPEGSPLLERFRKLWQRYPYKPQLSGKRARARDRAEKVRINGLSPKQWILEFFPHNRTARRTVPLARTVELLQRRIRLHIRQLGRERDSLRTAMAHGATTVREMEIERSGDAAAIGQMRARWAQRVRRLEMDIRKFQELLRLRPLRIREPADLRGCRFDRLEAIYARCDQTLHQRVSAGAVPFDMVEATDTLAVLRQEVQARVQVYRRQLLDLTAPEMPPTPSERFVGREVARFRAWQERMRTERAQRMQLKKRQREEEEAIIDIMEVDVDDDGDDDDDEALEVSGEPDADGGKLKRALLVAAGLKAPKERKRTTQPQAEPPRNATHPAVRQRRAPFRVMIQRLNWLQTRIHAAQEFGLERMRAFPCLQTVYGIDDAFYTLQSFNDARAFNRTEGRGMLRLHLRLANHRLALDPLAGDHQYLVALQNLSLRGETLRRAKTGGKKSAVKVDTKSKSQARYDLIRRMRDVVPEREHEGFWVPPRKTPLPPGAIPHWRYAPDAGPTALTWREDAEPLVDPAAVDILTDYSKKALPEPGSADFKELASKKETRGPLNYAHMCRMQQRLMERARATTNRYRAARPEPCNAYLLWNSSKAQLQFWLMERNEMFGIVNYVRVVDSRIPGTGAMANRDTNKTVHMVFYDETANPPLDLAPFWHFLEGLDMSHAHVFDAAWTLDYTRKQRSTTCLQIHDPASTAILEVFFMPQSAMIYVYDSLEDIKAWCLRRSRAWMLASTVMKQGRVIKTKRNKRNEVRETKIGQATMGSSALGDSMQVESVSMANKLARLCAKQPSNDPATLYSYVRDVLGIHVGPSNVSMRAPPPPPPREEAEPEVAAEEEEEEEEEEEAEAMEVEGEEVRRDDDDDDDDDSDDDSSEEEEPNFAAGYTGGSSVTGW